MQEPLKLAVALQYDGEQDAPVVIAAGRGDIAAKLIAAAEQEQVPVYEDPALAQTLVSLPLGTEIPPELYQAVAQIIVFVWQLDKKYGGEGNKL